VRKILDTTKRHVPPQITREFKRPAAIEPVIGLNEGHRNHLADAIGQSNAALAAAPEGFQLCLKSMESASVVRDGHAGTGRSSLRCDGKQAAISLGSTSTCLEPFSSISTKPAGDARGRPMRGLDPFRTQSARHRVDHGTICGRS